MTKTTLSNDTTGTSKIRSFLNAPSRLMAALYAACVAGMAGTTPTYCTANATMNNLFNSMVGIICTVALYVGAIIIVGGVFSWVLAQKDENADGQSRAVKFIVCGFALVALKVLIQPILTNLGLGG